MSAGCQTQAETCGCAHSRLPASRTLSCVPLGSVCARTVQPSPKESWSSSTELSLHIQEKKKKKESNLTKCPLLTCRADRPLTPSTRPQRPA